MPTPKKRYLDSTPAVTKQRLAKINKQANARERNIAKAYLEAGPNIVNLAKAAYHWYNSVPWLGGKDENGNIYVTGEAPTPGMRNPKNIVKFYHGSPVRFNKFDTSFIGSGEGGSKVMLGINLFPEQKIANAPKFANIRSSDAPIHLGRPSKPLTKELNPTVYDVFGEDLNLYKTSSREIKRLTQENLVKSGYDGVQTERQVTVFPEGVHKLKIDKQSSIEDFILEHPEVKQWTPWTTDINKFPRVSHVNMKRNGVK